MFDAVTIGASAGGFQALKVILPTLPKAFRFPVAIVHHIASRTDSYLSEHLNDLCEIRVKEAEDKEDMRPGTVYLAPAGYHLLIEPDASFSLSVEDKVNYCRPSIDVLFESAADAFGQRLIGIVLTGANADGAHGLKHIKEHGGFTIVQNPKTAESPYMPRAAIAATQVDHIEDLDKIAPLLIELAGRTSHETSNQN